MAYTVGASPATRAAASRVALAERHHPNEDHTELVRTLNAARALDWANAVAAAAPPLTDEQRVGIVRIVLGEGAV